jgi:hypothetical protein
MSALLINVDYLRLTAQSVAKSPALIVLVKFKPIFYARKGISPTSPPPNPLKPKYVLALKIALTDGRNQIFLRCVRLIVVSKTARSPTSSYVLMKTVIPLIKGIVLVIFKNQHLRWLYHVPRSRPPPAIYGVSRCLLSALLINVDYLRLTAQSVAKSPAMIVMISLKKIFIARQGISPPPYRANPSLKPKYVLPLTIAAQLTPAAWGPH